MSILSHVFVDQTYTVCINKARVKPEMEQFLLLVWAVEEFNFNVVIY